MEECPAAHRCKHHIQEGSGCRVRNRLDEQGKREATSASVPAPPPALAPPTIFASAAVVTPTPSRAVPAAAAPPPPPSVGHRIPLLCSVDNIVKQALDNLSFLRCAGRHYHSVSDCLCSTLGLLHQRAALPKMRARAGDTKANCIRVVEMILPSYSPGACNIYSSLSWRMILAISKQYG